MEESGLNIPEVLEVSQIDGEWALAIKYVEGKTMEELMKEDPANLEKYMEQFVDLQLTMHSKKAPRLTLQKDKFARKISTLKDTVDATTRYELHTRLDSMPVHTKLCHGDFNPSNVIVREDGTMTIVDWSHATQGNASGDAAITYLEFALKDQKTADLYLDLFCKRATLQNSMCRNGFLSLPLPSLPKESKRKKSSCPAGSMSLISSKLNLSAIPL